MFEITYFIGLEIEMHKAFVVAENEVIARALIRERENHAKINIAVCKALTSNFIYKVY